MKFHQAYAVAVALALLTGCSNKQIEYVYIEPECTVSAAPVLPVVNWDELSGSDDALDRLEEYEAAIIDGWLVDRAALRAICGD